MKLSETYIHALYSLLKLRKSLHIYKILYKLKDKKDTFCPEYHKVIPNNVSTIYNMSLHTSHENILLYQVLSGRGDNLVSKSRQNFHW